MVAKKKHPARKLLSFTSEELAAAYELAREVCPKGMKFDSIFWATDKNAGADGTMTVRRCVGIYKLKGEHDVQVWLDTEEVRTERAATAERYMVLDPGKAGDQSEGLYVPVPVPLKPARKYLKHILKFHGEDSLFYHLWSAIHHKDKAVLAAAAELKMELPPHTPIEKVIERLLREKDPAIIAQAARGHKQTREIAKRIGVKVPAIKKKARIS